MWRVAGPCFWALGPLHPSGVTSLRRRHLVGHCDVVCAYAHSVHSPAARPPSSRTFQGRIGWLLVCGLCEARTGHGPGTANYFAGSLPLSVVGSCGGPWRLTDAGCCPLIVDGAWAWSPGGRRGSRCCCYRWGAVRRMASLVLGRCLRCCPSSFSCWFRTARKRDTVVFGLDLICLFYVVLY